MKAAKAVIDRRALRHNFQRICQLTPHSRHLAVVKANAYGHGMLAVAEALDQADGYGVARLSEALMLRAGGVKKMILLLEGFFSANDLPLIVQNSIETAIHSEEQLKALEDTRLPEPITVWMKLDTGMHRLGVRLEQAEAFYQRLCACNNVRQPINVMSHFSQSDDPECGMTEKQIACLDAFAKNKPGQQSMAASGGILLWPQSHRNMVRPGIILYGVSPLENVYASHYGLQPVMTLTSSLIAVREHKAGEAVGYGGIWVASNDTKLGVVAIGYGDGYPRSAPTGTPVLINGREVPIVGRVSMDMITVDLGLGSTDRVGDEVIIWGSALPVEKIATYTDVSAYELITKLTSRVAREYVGK